MILEYGLELGCNAESIKEKMIEENSTQVDSISGVILSSNALKKAVNVALKEGYHNE